MDTPITIFFITSVTYQRKPWFKTTRFARILIDQWRYYEATYAFHLEAYCVLPDHYHAVLNIGTKKTLPEILHAVHSYTATLLNKALENKEKIKIWEGNVWDEGIRNKNMYWQKIAYTLFNPWRNGFSKDPLDDYPFSNLRQWKAQEGEEFLIDLFSSYKRWYE